MKIENANTDKSAMNVSELESSCALLPKSMFYVLILGHAEVQEKERYLSSTSCIVSGRGEPSVSGRNIAATPLRIGAAPKIKPGSQGM